MPFWLKPISTQQSVFLVCRFRFSLAVHGKWGLEVAARETKRDTDWEMEVPQEGE